MKKTSKNPPASPDTEKKASPEKETEIYKARISILVAIIGVLGSIGVAFITKANVKSSVQSDLENRFKNLRGIHFQSGYIGVNHSMPDWDLDDEPKLKVGKDPVPRIYKKHVDFEETFSSIPVVRMGMRVLDCSNKANTRIMVYPGDISTKGFDMVFQTWADSRVYNVEIDWFAYQQ